VLRGVDPSVEEGVEKNNVNRFSCREDVEGHINKRLKKLNRSTSCREAIEDLGTFSIDPPSCRGSVKIVIRKGLRSWQIAKCRECVEEMLRLLKNSFSRREKHRYECNQTCNSTKDPNNIL